MRSADLIREQWVCQSSSIDNPVPLFCSPLCAIWTDIPHGDFFPLVGGIPNLLHGKFRDVCRVKDRAARDKNLAPTGFSSEMSAVARGVACRWHDIGVIAPP